MAIDLTHMHLALAAAPVAGAFAFRELWTRHRLISEMKAREARAQVARQEAMRATQEALIAAETAQRTRDEFLARMSHELRTPLNAVIGFSKVLESNRAGNQRPEDIQLLARVRASGEQLLRMIEGVLDQSRIEQGQLQVNTADTDIVEIANRVVGDYRGAASAKGLRLIPVLPLSAPKVALDASRFEQVLQHLVDNAVKFTHSGAIRVTLVTDAATMHPTRLSVTDSGIGIPADRLDSIFEPFGQVDASRKRRYGGAGLGLPLASRLCRAMDCQLVVESLEGRGSKFTIRFPRSR